jgi:F420-dependent methylenetetrahydromethanopterin dehydrogenase
VISLGERVSDIKMMSCFVAGTHETTMMVAAEQLDMRQRAGSISAAVIINISSTGNAEWPYIWRLFYYIDMYFF